jgi:phosphoribosylglycinamide formyltransferase 1
MKKIVILISGRGSNLQAILQAYMKKTWPAKIVQVVSNNPHAPGIDVARDFQVPVTVLDHQKFPSREVFDQQLLQIVKSFQPDLVILAGFMRLLDSAFVNYFANRLINIHPSLLPSFPGLKTHQSAIQAGVKWHGATVHFVSQQMDVGPIIAQGIVPVLQNDTVETLANRVFQIEHVMYPQVIEWFVQDKLHIDNGKVRVDSEQLPFFMLSVQNNS